MNLRTARALCFACSGLLFGCHADVVESVVNAEHHQGFAGSVIKWEGDFFPCGDCEPAGDVYPIDTRIFICTGYVPQTDGVNPDPQFMDVVAVVPSTAESGYRVGLLPGIYTLFAEVDGRPYLNVWTTHPEADVNAYVYHNVVAGEYKTVEIEDTSEASF